METREKDRKQYKKPQVSQVKLEIEEAVLTACKLSGTDTSGKTNRGCAYGPPCSNTFGS